MTTFSEFMREIEREAEAEGPDAVAELREFHEWYRKTRQMMKMSRPTVREHPLVAEYLVTLEAPSQATSDAEKATVGSVCKTLLTGAVEGLAESLAETTHLTGYRVRIDSLAIGPKCAACSRSVLEQVSSAVKSNTEVMEAMQRVEKHREELVKRVAALEEERDILGASSNDERVIKWI